MIFIRLSPLRLKIHYFLQSPWTLRPHLQKLLRGIPNPPLSLHRQDKGNKLNWHQESPRIRDPLFYFPYLVTFS